MQNSIGNTKANPYIAGSIIARMERIPPTRLHLKARIIMGTATFFDAFDMLAISSMLPVLAGLWHLNPNQIGFIIAVGFAGQVLGALFFTWHAERYGRVSAAKYSIMLFSLMSLVCALAWSYESLCMFRFVQGIGLGGEVPVAAAYINEAVYRRTSWCPRPSAGFPAPIGAKPCSMPPQYRVRLNDPGRPEQARPKPGHPPGRSHAAADGAVHAGGRC